MSDQSVLPPPQLWGSLADVKQLEANSISAATTLERIFGSGAASIAAWCALYARAEGEVERYQLWLGAFKHIQASAVPRNA
jgi:hypothetical protein